MTKYRFAGFWRRFVAYVIDGVIISVVFMALMIIAGIAFFAGVVSGDSSAWVAKLSDPAQLGAFTVWMWLFRFGRFRGSGNTSESGRILPAAGGVGNRNSRGSPLRFADNHNRAGDLVMPALFSFVEGHPDIAQAENHAGDEISHRS